MPFSTIGGGRDNIEKFAMEYYQILAKEVSIPGTLKDDYFEIIRHKDHSVELNIYPRKKGKKVSKSRFYHRVFKRNETKEIRIYGLDGNDEYKISGKVGKSILVRIIAGFDRDLIEDKSKVKGLRKMTRIYDSKGKNKVKAGKETRVREMKDTKAYEYDRKDFIYNKLAPAISIGYNPNDGFYLGGGASYTAHGFKKSPYKHYHKVWFNRTFGAQGYNFYYTFNYTDLIGKADVGGKVLVNTPLVYQYFGQGNENTAIGNNPFDYQVRMNNVVFMPSIAFRSSTGSQKFKLNLDVQHVNFDIAPLAPVEEWELRHHNFLGATATYVYRNVDNNLNPNRGLEFNAKSRWNSSVNSGLINYAQLSGELRFYLPIHLGKKQTTLALRSGLSSNFGDYAFFQSNFLSGIRNFRGIQRNRFGARTSTYQNIELRKSLFKVKNYIAPFDFGLLAHYDLARVWKDNESSNYWHKSYGGGMYFNILDYFMLLGTYSISQTDQVLTVGTNYFF